MGDKRGKKRKAKDSKKSSKKKKKRKANSDLSDNEGGEPVEEEEEEQDYTPKAKSKKGAKKSADSSPAPTPQATNDETPSVEEVCENFVTRSQAFCLCFIFCCEPSKGRCLSTPCHQQIVQERDLVQSWSVSTRCFVNKLAHSARHILAAFVSLTVVNLSFTMP